MSKGTKLWSRAKEIIPGGNMLLSKRSEMFLPNFWPSYYSKAKGCEVWDLDKKKYFDMSIMGIGTNTLGYCHEEIDDFVKSKIDGSNMSTLNCPEEVYLAEKLIEIHPWADMVRFARSGGEANAIAVRIARAKAGKEKIAICGYHGWHDWYLAANINDKNNLENHLLPGLNPSGVPKNLKNTIFTFNYNDINELENLIRKHDIGVVKMEVVRNKGPINNFLHKVREITKKNNIVLIFDECTSGFRQSNGGIHKIYNVEPDIAVFGKALGNGYAITCVIGNKEVMNNAQSTFISSTFWTERIGPSAGLKTLEVMNKTKSWDLITNTGNKIIESWKKLSSCYGLEIDVNGIPAIPSFTIKSNNFLAYKTFITQEMLKNNFLASNLIYVCIEHKPDIIEEYLYILEKIFSKLSDCENGDDIYSYLLGPVCHSGFKRLN